MATNCFTIGCTKPMRDGVPWSEDILFSHFGAAQGVYMSDQCTVWLGEHDGIKTLNYPEIHKRYLTRAKVLMRPGGRPLFVRAGLCEKSIIVLILCAALRFEIEPINPDLNLWPGGDGKILPFAQSDMYGRSYPLNALYEIPNGDSIFVTDNRCASVRLTNKDGVPHFTTPNVQDLVEFMCAHAKAEGTARALGWAIHNLRTLQTAGSGSQQLHNMLDELKRLRSSLTRRPK